MRKACSLLLACVLFLSFSAFAEASVDGQTSAEPMEQNVLLSGADGDEYSFHLPEGWLVDEPSDADPEEGLLLSASSEDGRHQVTLTWIASRETSDAATLLEKYRPLHDDAAILSVNGTDFISFTDSETGAAIAILPGDGGQTLFTLSSSEENAAALLQELLQSAFAADGFVDLTTSESQENEASD